MATLSAATALLTRKNDESLFCIWLLIVKSNTISLYSLVSLIMSCIDYFITIFNDNENDISKQRFAWLGILLFTLSFSYQCFSEMFPHSANEVGAISLLLVTSVLYLYYNIRSLRSPYNTNVVSSELENLTLEKALVRFAKLKIRNCHEAITSIQIYEVKKNNLNKQIYYDIEYLDSGHRNGPSLNAVLNTQLSISEEEYNLFQAYRDTFEKYLCAENDAAQETCSATMEQLSKSHIAKIKQALSSRINSVSEINISDCCSSRLILIYLSCLARVGMENAGDYVGVQCQSLNVCCNNSETDEINKQLFSKFRTGFLGALLLRTRPYVFYYEQDYNKDKANRQYISFLLEHEKLSNSYLVLITSNQQSNSGVLLYSLLGAVKAIREECVKLCLKEVKKQNAST